MRRFLTLAAWMLIVPVAVTGPAGGQKVDARVLTASFSDGAPAVVGTILLPGRRPVALAFYEAGNKLFVTDDVSGNLLVIDGTTREVVSSVAVGVSAYEIIVNESFGKVYVASDGSFNDGTGLISVIDADNGTLITRLDPGDIAGDLPGRANEFRLRGDEVHDKVYVSLFCPFCDPLGVIDVASDQYTPIAANIQWGWGHGLQGVNTVTNDAFAVGRDLDQRSGSNDSLITIDGDTLQLSWTELPHPAGPLDFAANEVDNKVYVFVSPAFNDWSGLMIHDRKAGTFKNIENPNRNGTEPLVFNQVSDKLFSGVTVGGKRGIVVDGVTDELTYVRLRGDGMGAAAVRNSTDNAFFAGIDGRTFIVNGSTKRVGVIPSKTGIVDTDGEVASSIDVDQVRGLVYLIHDDEAGRITIIKDGVLPPPPETTITRGPSGRTTLTTVTFRFKADQPDVNFKCKLDWTWHKCSSPKRYKNLFPDRYVFRVKTRNGLGMTDPTPAKRAFRVVR